MFFVVGALAAGGLAACNRRSSSAADATVSDGAVDFYEGYPESNDGWYSEGEGGPEGGGGGGGAGGTPVVDAGQADGGGGWRRRRRRCPGRRRWQRL